MWSNDPVKDIKIRPLGRVDLKTLLEVLDDPKLDHLYGIPSSYGTKFAAWQRGRPVGLLHVNFNSDFHENDVWQVFNIPPAPHAYLIRAQVEEASRGAGIGRALIGFLAEEAEARGCTFIGGMLDWSSDPQARRRFFQRCGFTIAGQDHIGATPSEVAAATPTT